MRDRVLSWGTLVGVIFVVAAMVTASVSAQSAPSGPGRPAFVQARVMPDGTVAYAAAFGRGESASVFDQQMATAVDALKKAHLKDGRPMPVVIRVQVPQTQTAKEALKLPSDDFAKGAIAEGSPNLIDPVVVRSSEPKYTSDAMRNKIQGTVEVELIIGTQGTVTDARVSESLDKVYGLDEEALRAVRSWLFKPGTLGGKPVPVYTKITMAFRLH